MSYCETLLHAMLTSEGKSEAWDSNLPISPPLKALTKSLIHSCSVPLSVCRMGCCSCPLSIRSVVF